VNISSFGIPPCRGPPLLDANCVSAADTVKGYMMDQGCCVGSACLRPVIACACFSFLVAEVEVFRTLFPLDHVVPRFWCV
jgi:hypothetical protein